VFCADHPWSDDRLARLYDAFPFEADVSFYVELARQAGGRVLEVGCGTGRLLLPLAAAGHRVIGVDVSAHMLAVARGKLSTAGDEVAARVRLVQADMRDLRLDGEADLAVLPVKTFAYLVERADQLRALTSTASSLRPGGLLVLDLLNPTPGWVGRPDGSVRQDVAGEIDGEVVVRTETAVSTDTARQVRVVRSAYDIVAADGTVRKRVVQWPFRWTYRFEAELLLEQAGLRVEEVYGGYAGEPYSTQSRCLLLVARRP
jgi:SAM-dependent methyltransferase